MSSDETYDRSGPLNHLRAATFFLNWFGLLTRLRVAGNVLVGLLLSTIYEQREHAAVRVV